MPKTLAGKEARTTPSARSLGSTSGSIRHDRGTVFVVGSKGTTSGSVTSHRGRVRGWRQHRGQCQRRG